MYQCLDCGNNEKFYTEAIVTKVAIIDERGDFQGWDVEDYHNFSKPEGYKETGYRWCAECDSDRIVNLCPFIELLECDEGCTYEEWKNDEHPHCAFNELEGYKCPECEKGILNPTDEWMFKCDKCDFEKRIVMMIRKEGFEELPKLLGLGG